MQDEDLLAPVATLLRYKSYTTLLDLYPLPSTCPLFLVGHQLRSTNKRQYPFRDMTDNRFGLPPATVMAGGLPLGDPAPPCSVRQRDAPYQQVVVWPS